MKICFVCKYPPIQGGVSAYAYWAARGLAKRGHQVIVVTNADEVESAFRMHLSASDRGPNGAYAPVFEDSGGFVQVFSTKVPDPEELYYIPMGNPTVTRLSAMAADLVRKYGCEVIYANYLEPYGVAAHLASMWTGVPYIIQHAGSDLGRLMPRPDLKTAYFEVLAAADRILSREPSRSKLIEYGILEERISSTAEFSPPLEFFHPEGSALPMDIDKTLLLAQSSTQAKDGRYAPLNPAWPILGVYGKIGEYKGSYDLLLAMAKVIDLGLPFHLVALSQEEHVRVAAKRLGLSDYVRALPFVPPWQIPSFIWRCDAIAFLERNFPITAHAPVVPLEVVRCGKCLIVSSEVALKQPFRHLIRDKKNAVVVADPTDHKELASQIIFALESLKRTKDIGQHAADTLAALSVDRHEACIDKLHNLFAEVAQEKSARSIGQASKKATRTYLEASATLFPLVSKMLNEQNKAFLSKITCDISEPASITATIGRKLMEILQEESSSQKNPSAAFEICRYECKLHAWADNSSLSIEHGYKPMAFSPKDLALLYPALTNEWEIAEFKYDIDAISSAIEDKDGAVFDFKPQPIWILFHRGGIPARVNALTARLIALLGQRKTNIAGVFNALAGSLGIIEEAPMARLTEGAASALEGLYWAGILRFEQASKRSGA
jgi:glycosyltransferase involved in cell wall biosynthesis